jgi:Ca-activated chloride channel family protein
VDELRYQRPAELTDAAGSAEVATLKIRYKEPDGDQSRLLTFPVADRTGQESSLNQEFQFASAVAAFGMLLRNSEYKGEATFDNVLEWAQAARGEDRFGYRAEFIGLVRSAGNLSRQQAVVNED